MTTENRIEFVKDNVIVVESKNDAFGTTFWVFSGKTAGAVKFDTLEAVKDYLRSLR